LTPTAPLSWPTFQTAARFYKQFQPCERCRLDTHHDSARAAAATQRTYTTTPVLLTDSSARNIIGKFKPLILGEVHPAGNTVRTPEPVRARRHLRPNAGACFSSYRLGVTVPPSPSMRSILAMMPSRSEASVTDRAVKSGLSSASAGAGNFPPRRPPAGARVGPLRYHQNPPSPPIRAVDSRPIHWPSTPALAASQPWPAAREDQKKAEYLMRG
jgi:hypothetical protein